MEDKIEVKGGGGSGNFGHEGRPGEIGGSGEGGGSSSNSGTSRSGSGWSSPREEFRFVQQRLGTPGLKKGEKRMLERRSENLAKQVLGVNP
jgi:hypothetical protein